ncbi:MAG: hypothetical protein ACOYEV_04220 [Candidatus Nanopelagicales bacterium]
MGRKNRREQPHGPHEPRNIPAQEHADGSWHVRSISGAAAAKVYLCPGCNQQIPAGTPHIVAWSADHYLGEELRRHWHTPCWAQRAKRRPG